MTDDPLIARADAVIRESERLRLETRERLAAATHEIDRHQRASAAMDRLFRDASRANLARLPLRERENGESPVRS